jgi:hypothetical protein
MARDEFSDAKKRTMAERVGWRCSFPSCPLATVGPHTDDDKAIRLGEAAHITAASPEGPRYDARLTSEQRRNISNGIWMCLSCPQKLSQPFVDSKLERRRIYDAEVKI